MRYSAIGRREPSSRDWPTECPHCGDAELAYQYEAAVGDLYQCRSCLGLAMVREHQRRNGEWYRRIAADYAEES